MDDLMKCLYEFVTTRRLGTLRDDPEYRDRFQDVDLQWNRLEEGLDEEQRQKLRTLMEAVTAQNSVEQEHLFRAALKLARELNALMRA